MSCNYSMAINFPRLALRHFKSPFGTVLDSLRSIRVGDQRKKLERRTSMAVTICLLGPIWNIKLEVNSSRYIELHYEETVMNIALSFAQ